MRIENTEALIQGYRESDFHYFRSPNWKNITGSRRFPVDMHAVLRRMGELNSEGELKAVEINASPYRLDLDWRLCHLPSNKASQFVSILMLMEQRV